MSDGLLLDLNRICEQSQKGAVVSIHDRVFINSIEDLVGGDDYVLLFTCPSKHSDLCKENFAKFNQVGKNYSRKRNFSDGQDWKKY